MAKRDEAPHVLGELLTLPPSCSIRNAGDIARSLRNCLDAGVGARIDCASVEQVDITFIQLIVSAERSFAARGLPLAIEAVPAAVLSAFARAAVPRPDAAQFETSRN